MGAPLAHGYAFGVPFRNHLTRGPCCILTRGPQILSVALSTVQISFGFSDTFLNLGYLQIFSVRRGLSPTRKSEKRVFYEIVWTSMVHPLLLNCTNRAYELMFVLSISVKFIAV